MFGLNDTNAQQTDKNSSPGIVDAPATPQNNPFSDGTSGDTPAQPEALLSNTPKEPTAPAFTAPPVPDEPAASAVPAPAVSDDNLMDLKQQALQSLQPLVSHLDQSPEEKFKTTMMLIQATDNSSLVNQAYEAANQIPDEKARAQALLDVVNEIN